MTNEEILAETEIIKDKLDQLLEIVGNRVDHVRSERLYNEKKELFKRLEKNSEKD